MMVSWLDVDQWLWAVEGEGMFLLALIQKATSMDRDSETFVREL